VSKLERQAYEQRLKPDHPVHEQAKEAMRVYFRAVAEGKAKHWVEYLADGGVWNIHKLLNTHRLTGVPHAFQH
jgi:hypothetical protein